MSSRRTNPWIFALADDLTGALETGAQFAGRGFSALVTTETSLATFPDVTALVVDTESRHLTASEAAPTVRSTAIGARTLNPWLIYKKTDSALRGNIAAELRALLEVFPERRLVYSPAYPALGRTVEDGRLLIDGVPVQESAFAADPLNPIRDSRIAAILGDIPAEVVDATSDADVLAAAQRILSSETPPLAAGPAAFAGALAHFLPFPRGNCRPLPRVPRCLVINGSLHPASVEQVTVARAQGCFNESWHCFEDHAEGTGMDRARKTGERVREVLQTMPVDGICVFGGDTAFGIHQALGARQFDSYGEILPGVPLSRAGNLFWITKAGGFGRPDIICDIQRRLG